MPRLKLKYNMLIDPREGKSSTQYYNNANSHSKPTSN